MLQLEARGGNLLLTLLVAIDEEGKALALQVAHVDVKERARQRQVRRQTALRHRKARHAKRREARY